MKAQGPYRELTLSSVLGGVLVGVILNMGIVFAGMQIGFTIVGSAVGAILGFGILRGILRRGTILEVNVFQTVASAVNTVNAGVIFTVPVLFLLGMQDRIDYASLLLATMAGSLLGVMMIIPLRKQIIDFERLRFPSGIGVAAILRSPGAGRAKAVRLSFAVCLAMVVSGLTLSWTATGATLLPDTVDLGHILGVPPAFELTLAVSLLSLGAGFIAGRPGLVVLYGTVLNYWFLVPMAIVLGWVPAGFADFRVGDASAAAFARAGDFHGAFAHFTSRHVGIGMILGGAVAGVVVALPALRAAFASLRGGGEEGGRREELSLRTIGIGLAIGVVALLIATKLSVGSTGGWGITLVATGIGVIWLWLAGLVVAQTTGRTDWSPLSGLALLAVAVTMGVFGLHSEGSILPAVTVGAAICVATSMCADMLQDLKTGYLVGGLPRRQQIAQVATSWIGPGIAMATVLILWKAYAFGPDQARILWQRAEAKGPEAVAALQARGGSETRLPEGTPELKAPQAAALSGAIELLRGGNAPVGKYLTGAALGLAVSLLVSPGLGVMIGLSLYLPFKYLIVFGIGGLLSILATRWRGARFAEEFGIPIAAGLIVGDALIGVINAVTKVVSAF